MVIRLLRKVKNHTMAPRYTILSEKGQCSNPTPFPGNPYVNSMDLEFEEEAMPSFQPSRSEVPQSNDKVSWLLIFFLVFNYLSNS